MLRPGHMVQLFLKRCAQQDFFGCHAMQLVARSVANVKLESASATVARNVSPCVQAFRLSLNRSRDRLQSRGNHPSLLTFVRFKVVQQTDLSEMLRCRDRKRHCVTYSFMESRVSTVTEDVRLVPEQHEVVDVTHLMVCCDKPILRYLCALMNPEKNTRSKLTTYDSRRLFGPEKLFSYAGVLTTETKFSLLLKAEQ